MKECFNGEIDCSVVIQGMNQTFDVIVKVDPETDEFLVEWELLNEY